MKDKLKAILKRWPNLYNFAERGHATSQNICHKLKVHLLGTRLEEKYWATRHFHKGDDWGDVDGDWIRGYWESRVHSHRNFLIEKVSRFSPSSILEVGCNCGPNLYLLAKRFPTSKIVGIDINPMAVQKGKEWLAQEGISNVELFVGKADDLGQFQNKSFDVVFSDAVLIYIGPDKIEKVIAEMLRVAGRALILLEWHCFNFKSKPLGIYVGHWARDYVALLKKFIPEEKICIIKLPEELWPDKNWQRWGGVIEAIVE